MLGAERNPARTPSRLTGRAHIVTYVTYVIGEPCTDILDRGGVEVRPVDGIYEGDRASYIHHDECVDCGAYEPDCPDEANSEDDALPQSQPYLKDIEKFFTETLPGRPEPLACPGGAAKLGRLGVNTPLVASQPQRPQQPRQAQARDRTRWNVGRRGSRLWSADRAAATGGPFRRIDKTLPGTPGLRSATRICEGLPCRAMKPQCG